MNIDESVLRAMVIRLEYDAAVKAAEVAAKEEAPVEAVEAVEAAEATDAE
jgi:ribosomal protein S6